MPDHSILLTEAERTLLERVQAQNGFPTLAAAAEWLVKTRLRRAAHAVSGRRKALYLVPRPPEGTP